MCGGEGTALPAMRGVMSQFKATKLFTYSTKAAKTIVPLRHWEDGYPQLQAAFSSAGDIDSPRGISEFESNASQCDSHPRDA